MNPNQTASYNVQMEGEHGLTPSKVEVETQKGKTVEEKSESKLKTCPARGLINRPSPGVSPHSLGYQWEAKNSLDSSPTAIGRMTGGQFNK